MGGRRLATGWLVAAVVLGVLARLTAALQGHNFDVDSYWIVAGHVLAGDNVYAATDRYNYGPTWAFVVAGLKLVADLTPDPFETFRLLVAGFLTAVDLAIAAMLRWRFGPLTAAGFMLVPVAALVTGYHSQFDNLAIGIGLGAMLLVERAKNDAGRAAGRGWWTGLGLLGLSLATKHILLLLPVWLAMRQASPGRAGAVLLVPLSILVASFLPFVPGGLDGIVSNVIGYRGLENPPFHTYLLPPLIQRLLSPVVLFGIAVLVIGWLMRRRSAVEQLLIYSVTIVVFAPAMGNQYLAIPVVATIVFVNVGYVAYLAVATIYMLGEYTTLGTGWLTDLLPRFLVRTDTSELPFGYLVALLGIGLVISLVELRTTDDAEMRA